MVQQNTIASDISLVVCVS